jgi:hypothetical protein
MFVLVITSCRREKHSTGWNTQDLVPIATTSLTLTNLVTDSSIKKNSDSSLTLSYSSSLYQFNLANQIIKVPDTSIGQKFSLTDLLLPVTRVYVRESLGEIATNLINSGNPGNAALGQFILNAAASGQPTVVPPLNNIPFPPVLFNTNANGMNLFDSAYLISGSVSMEIANYLPIGINAGYTMSLSNDIPGHTELIYASPPQGAIGAFDSIYPTFNIPSPGIPVPVFLGSILQFVLANVSSPGSPNIPVTIDTSQAIIISVNVNSVHVSEAWAKFPNENVVNIGAPVTVNFADRKFTYIEAASGSLHIYIYNSIPQPLKLRYTLAGAYNNRGQPLSTTTTIPAAPVGGVSEIDTIISIAGYSISLTGPQGNLFNTYNQQIVAQIDSTGQTAHITLADSLNIQYHLENIAPSYIKGYAGRDTVTASDSSAFSFLNIFKSGRINLQNVNMNFTVVNGLGVDGQVIIDSLTAYSATNPPQTLTGPNIIGKPLTITPATDFPLTPSINNFAINSGNSNIQNLLGILPNKLTYKIRLKTNVNGDNHQYREFAYLNSSLGINLNANIPLSLLANNLLLVDTIGFNLSNTQTNVAGITDGTINVIVENKYPITTDLSIVIYDGNWSPLDTLVNNGQIAAAGLDNNCRAEQPEKTVLQVYVNQTIMNKIKQGQHAIITANFNTASNKPTCNGQYLKIYSDYSVGITLSAKFNYKVSTNTQF